MADNEEHFPLLQAYSKLPLLSTSYVLTTFVVVVTLIYFYNGVKWKKQKGYYNTGKKRMLSWDDIPGETPLLPFEFTGNLLSLWPLSRSIEKGFLWTRKYPGLFKMTGVNQKLAVFTSPQCLQQLFKSTDFGHNTKAPIVYDMMKPFISNGLLVSTGKFWQSQRKIMLKTQSFPSLKAYMGLLNRHSEDFVETLGRLFEDGEPHEINEPINVTFLKVICEMITGYDVKSSSEFDRYHHNFQIWKEALMTRLLYPWFTVNALWKLHPLCKRQKKAVEEMFDFAKRRIKEHRDEKAEHGCREKHAGSVETENIPNNHSPFRSLLDELLDADVDDNQIVDEVNTMLFGGHETGATAIHFLCFCLALNPDIQEECRKEVDGLFQNPEFVQNGAITYDGAHSNLKYVERCILETLRLFPPVFMALRRLETPFSFEHNENQYHLPAGTLVVVTPYGTHRIAEHFQDPLKFDPDRFLPEEAAKRHPCAFIPFSGGQRNCLGIKFAMIEMKVIVAHLLRNFVMRTTDKMEDIPLLPYITLTPAKDYTFKFTKRIKASKAYNVGPALRSLRNLVRTTQESQQNL